VKKFKKKKTLLCSAFPGTGKSYFYTVFGGMDGKVILDSDSSTFNKVGFPTNYIEYIKANIGKADIIFISSHKEVRDALVEEGLEFTLVYPNPFLKIEYINRYKTRGNDFSFVKLLETNWIKWMRELTAQKGCFHVLLGTNEYISDKKEIFGHLLK